MSKVHFTKEQLEILKNNPYTYHVTPNTLYLTAKFKELFYQKYVNGESPKNILEECGYLESILGKQRIWGITAIIKNEYRKYGFFHETSFSKTSKSTLPEEFPCFQILRLQHEVEHLEQEIATIKGFLSNKNFGKQMP